MSLMKRTTTPLAIGVGMVLLAFALGLGNSSLAAMAAQQEDARQLQEKWRRGAQRELAGKVRSGVEADRIEAAIELRKYPILDAARMCNNLLDDKNAEVREAAHETIISYHTSPAVCRFYLGQLRTESRRQGWDAVGYSMLYSLAMCKDEKLRDETITMIDAHAAARPNNVLVLNSVLEGFGEQGDNDALAGLDTLRHSALVASDFGIRRGLIQAIIAIRTPEAIDLLLEILPVIDGEVRGDAVKYLSALSGERYGENPDQWKMWWDKKRDGFKFPNKLASPADIMAAFAAEGTATYYDLPIFARRMVFIIDCSDSMNQRGRIQAAKQELLDAINALDEEKYFNIVAFNSRVAPWQGDLQPATTLAKANAARWIESLRPQELTASYDALEATFSFKNLEAIYFVSDGAPTMGKIVEKEKIVEAVREGNRIRRVTLYTLGIEPDDDDDNTFEGFLKSLAEENYGIYRPVGDFSRKQE